MKISQYKNVVDEIIFIMGGNKHEDFFSKSEGS